MTDPPVRLVCFDLGRVLVRICRDWREACARAGLDAPAGLERPGTRELLGQIERQFEIGALDTGACCRELGACLGLSPDAALAALDAWLLGPYPGARELVSALLGGQVPVACLTNTNAHHFGAMTRPGDPNFLPLEQMAHRFASHLLGCRKPGSAIYELSERRTGASPASILYFDDAPENVHAARSRGWRAVLVHDDGDPTAQLALELGRAGLCP